MHIVKTFMESSGFDWFALTCSAIYFILFVVFLGCFETGKCTAEEVYIVNLLKILFLIPPIIYFIKMTYATITSGIYSIKRSQLSILVIYFILVFIFLSSELAGDKETAKNTNTVCVFILPILILLSFYNTYDSWMNKGPRPIVILSMLLSILYYCLFYFSLRYGGSVFGDFGNKSVSGMLMAIGILLVFQFFYVAGLSWNKSSLKSIKLLDTIINAYLNLINGITSKIIK